MKKLSLPIHGYSFLLSGLPFILPKEHILFLLKTQCDMEKLSSDHAFSQIDTVNFKDGATEYKMVEYHKPKQAQTVSCIRYKNFSL